MVSADYWLAPETGVWNHRVAFRSATYTQTDNLRGVDWKWKKKAADYL